MASKEVYSKLPIFVRQEVLDANPNFARLLEDISTQHLTRDGTSKNLEEQYEKAKLEMENEKQRYLENLTLYQSLRSLIEDYQIEATSDSDHTDLQNEHKVYQLLNHFLTVAESSQKLSIVPNNRLDEQLSKLNLNLLGLSKDQLLSTQIDESTYKQNISYLQDHLFFELEQRLVRRVEQVYNFCNPPTEEEEESSYQSKHVLLQQLVASKVNQLKREREGLKLDQLSTERAFWEYFKTLGKTLDVLSEILQDHKLKKQFQFEEVNRKWLESQFTTMVLKLQAMKYQYLTETYTAETVPALKKIRGYLEVACKQALEEYEQAIKRLQEYESIGLGFDALVTEYASILNEIKEKTWALNELLSNK